MHTIMKNGLWLAYKNYSEESDYWEVSEITAEIKNGWYWCDDIEHAKCFLDYQDAAYFLAKKRGAFWDGAEVKIYKI